MSAWVFILDRDLDKKFSAKQRLGMLLGGLDHVLKTHRGDAPGGEGQAHFFLLSDAGEQLFEARHRPEWRRLDRRPSWDVGESARSGIRRFLPW